jgi:fructose/tagatose bisphosphate aldolase
MSLESVQTMAQRALANGYAVGYFESWNLESLQGVIDAAEETSSPIVVGFNGKFLSNAHSEQKERIYWYAAPGRKAAESASVPCGLIFNECLGDDMNRLAVDAGFNCVMPANIQHEHETPGDQGRTESAVPRRGRADRPIPGPAG